MSLSESPRIKGPMQVPPGSKPVAVKARLTRDVGKRCPYCADEMTLDGETHVSREHILPRYRVRLLPEKLRAIIIENNTISVCGACNGLKGSKTLFGFHCWAGRHDTRRALITGQFLDLLRARLPANVFLMLTGAQR